MVYPLGFEPRLDGVGGRNVIQLHYEYVYSIFAPALGLFSRKVRFPLRSVTLTPTYRRSLISPLQSIINALFNG